MQSVVFSNSLFDYSVPLNKLFLHSKLSSSVNNIFVLYFLTQSCYFGSDRNYSERRRWVIIPCYNRMDNDPYRDHHHARATKLHKVSFVDPHGAHRAFCSSLNFSTTYPPWPCLVAVRSIVVSELIGWATMPVEILITFCF